MKKELTEGRRKRVVEKLTYLHHDDVAGQQRGDEGGVGFVEWARNKRQDGKR